MLLRRFFLLVPVLFVPAAAIAQAKGGVHGVRGVRRFVGSTVRPVRRFDGSAVSHLRSGSASAEH